MKKNFWIKVRAGLLEAKHRDKMAHTIWLYLYMLHIVDWDTGVIENWKDENASTDLNMELRTLREHRRKLEEENYITCQQNQYDQTIIIHNYIDPRKHSEELDNPDGSRVTSQRNQGISKDVTPTFNTHKISMPRETFFTLRNHFSEIAKIKQPPWSSLNSKDRRKYMAWWHNPLKNMWISCEQNEEFCKKVITATVKGVDFSVYAPISIEKSFYKFIGATECEIPNASDIKMPGE